MNVDLTINPRKEKEKIVSFIKDTVKRAGFEKVILGLSGGIDSATVCLLAAGALGADNVFAAILPFGNPQNQAAADARHVSGQAGITGANIIEIDIELLSGEYLREIPESEKLRRGNVAARMRMIVLYDLSKKYRTLVMGTENRSEHMLGYFTRFGDEASDIEPIRHLYKTQVRQLADYLKVPVGILEKEPTAGLWEGQTDEGEFGFTYAQADIIMHLYSEKKLTEETISGKGFDRETVGKVIKRIKENEFKHRLPFIY